MAPVMKDPATKKKDRHSDRSAARLSADAISKGLPVMMPSKLEAKPSP